MARVAFIAHCLLNQNAKVIGGAKRPGMWEPVIDLLTERGFTVRHWFPDYDPDEERGRLVALLDGEERP